MNNEKTISAVIAFAVAFIFSTGLVRIFIPPPLVSERAVLVQTRDVNASALERFIARDAENAWVRDNQSRGLSEAEAVTKYWKMSASMDTSEFSPEFATAWNEHMDAWRNFANFESAIESNPDIYAQSRANELNREINRTWYNVINIARHNGADVSY